ncbi:MAG: Holliday junction resolvase RuvX [Chlamydiae bacterium]|nr:Holliday junction resolvase RuvX [Chlamydiota bacterium]
MGRILGLDYGTKRIGIAISDERGIIASPLTFINREKSFETCAKQISDAITGYSPFTKIVIGLPLHMDGNESEMSQEVKKFAKVLELVFFLPVQLWDERLTSSQVEKGLKERNMNRKKRVQVTDALAAAIILQTYLDAQ